LFNEEEGKKNLSEAHPKVTKGFYTLPCLRKSWQAMIGHDWSGLCDSCQITKKSHVSIKKSETNLLVADVANCDPGKMMYI